MKKVLCTLFGENEYIFFDVGRLAQLEMLEGRSFADLLIDGKLSLNTILNAYSVGMAQHKRRPPQWYAEKLQELVEQGITYIDFAEPVMKALIASGMFGKDAYYQAFPEELTEDAETEIEIEKRTARKNK